MEGVFPDVDQCVVVVVPHTHWMDFLLGVVVRSILAKEINYIGKRSLFRPPFGWFFRWMGGVPVDRDKNSNTVDSRSEEHTSELQSQSTISYAVFCLKKKKPPTPPPTTATS